MLDRKMEEAKHLVLESDLSISDIAKIRVQQSHSPGECLFSKFGIPPFRNRMQKNKSAILLFYKGVVILLHNFHDSNGH